MSNFLTNVKIGNLQTELDVLSAYTHEQVFAGGLKNPLGSAMICQGNAIQGAGPIDTTLLTATTLTTTGQANFNSVVISDTLNVGSITTTEPLTVSAGLKCNQITTIDYATDPTLNITAELAIAGGVTTTSITANNITATTNISSTTISGTTVKADTLDANTAPYISINAPVQILSNTGITTPAIQVNGLNPYGVGENINVSCPIESSYDITTTGTISAGNFNITGTLTASDLEVLNINQTSQQGVTVSGPIFIRSGGMINCTLTEAPYTRQYSLNNVATLVGNTVEVSTVKTNSLVFNNDASPNPGQIISVIGNLQVGYSTPTSTLSYDILGTNSLGLIPAGQQNFTTDTKVRSSATPTVGTGCLQVSSTSNSCPGTWGTVYDTVYNIPPGVGATTLSAVLTAGHSAPTQSMTVEEVISVTSTQNYLKLPDVIGSNGDSIFLNNQNGILSIGDVLAPGTTPPVPLPGQVYDTYYNKPPQTFGGAITDSGGITIMQRTVAHFYQQYSSNGYAWAPLFELSQSQSGFNNMTTTFDSMRLNTNHDGSQLVQPNCYLYLTSDLRAYPEIILPQQPNPTMLSCNYAIMDFTTDPTSNVNLVLPYLNTIVDTPYTSPTVYITLAVPYTTETIFDPAGYAVFYNYQGGFLSVQQDQKVAVVITPYTQ